MLEVTLSVFLFFHYFSFYRQTEPHAASTQGPGCLMKGSASVLYLSIFSARDFEGFHCFNHWPPPALVSMTGASAAAMLEIFASGEAFFAGSEPVSRAFRFMAFHGAGILPWGH
ncbi:hypothetical protein HHJ06_01135 [Akkermansia muciniphila]|nr:hypothetical protein [Akkermansia muciniphila]